MWFGGETRTMDIEKQSSHHQHQHLQGKFKTILCLPILATEMKVLRRQANIKNLLVVIGILSILAFLFTFFHTTLESSYLDLVDSLIPESTATIVETVDPITNPIILPSHVSENACKGTEWITEWISSGSMPNCSLTHKSKVDVLYTWVNGSETLYQNEKSFWQEKSPVFGGQGFSHDRKIRVTTRRHREHDELRYSVRSIFKYLDTHFSNIRILASDFYDGKKWIGQVPTWLDVEAGKQHGVSMIYTSEVYGANKKELPVFNSLALESKFSNVVSTTGNDVMLYMNDDMFLASHHTVSDFWNPIIGLNIQLDPQSWVENQDPSVADFQWDWNSEWTALRYSNHLLSQRFGTRRRTYVAHFAKPLSRTILKEIEEEFPSEIHNTSTHRFRSEGKDVNTIFLHSHYLIERHRETLLSSLLHRSDMNADGALDFEERKVLISQLELALTTKFIRKTSEQQNLAMEVSGLPAQKASSSVWCSTDGYPFAFKTATDASVEQAMKTPNRPTFGLKDKPHDRKAEFDVIETCFTSDFTAKHLVHTVVDVGMLFKLIAREYPYCGDMILATLIPSAATGLAHILPAPSHPKYAEMVAGLHKYAYTISESHSEFIMARSADALKKGFVRVLKSFRFYNVAQFCVNDDVEQSEGIMVQNMDYTFKGILQGYFGALTENRGRSPVEKVETVEEINSAGMEFWGGRVDKGGPGYRSEETTTASNEEGKPL